MSLQEIRKNRNLTQKELAQKAGINFRSLQDYEQGHKKLASANGDILLRLSTVLGCSVEELLISDMFHGAPLLPGNTIDVHTIQSQRFYCEKYQTAGRWVCSGGKVATMFYYNGKQYCLPFRAIFKPELLHWLMESAKLQMEDTIESIAFDTEDWEEW